MPAPFVKYAFFFPFIGLYFFVKNQAFEGVWINNWVFDSVLLVFLSVFMAIPSCFQYCSFVVKFEVRNCDASRSSFIVQDCFGYPGFFAFPNKVEYCSFKICEEFCWILMGLPWICRLFFGEVAIFTVLIFLTQKHGRSFHFRCLLQFLSSKI